MDQKEGAGRIEKISIALIAPKMRQRSDRANQFFRSYEGVFCDEIKYISKSQSLTSEGREDRKGRPPLNDHRHLMITPPARRRDDSKFYIGMLPLLATSQSCL